MTAENEEPRGGADGEPMEMRRCPNYVPPEPYGLPPAGMPPYGYGPPGGTRAPSGGRRALLLLGAALLVLAVIALVISLR